MPISPAGWSTPTLTTLKAIGDDIRSAGYARLVIDQRAWYVFVPTATDISDEPYVIIPDVGSGRWFRLKSHVTTADVVALEEFIEDVIAGALSNTGDISFAYSDASNTITANIRTGVIVDADVNSSAAIAQSKIANLVSDLSNKANVNHTHTSSNISDFSESVDDRVATFLVAGTNVSLVHDDALNTLTINVDVGSSLNETIDDRVATLLAAGPNITLDYNDASNVLTISASGSGGGFGGGWDDIGESDWDILFSG